MKQMSALQTATVALGVLSALCLCVYFFALNDIADDYVSPQIAEQHGLTLPNWTACSSEWNALNLGIIPILGFHVLALCNRARRSGR